MEREGEEEEAVADHNQGLAVSSALRCWCMLDCEDIGYCRQSNSSEA